LLLKPIQKKIKEKLDATKKKMLWNGTIRIMTIGYINYCASWVLNMRLKFLDPNAELSATDYILNPIIGLYLIVYPIFCLYFVMRRSNEYLSKKENQEKYKLLYPGVNIYS